MKTLFYFKDVDQLNDFEAFDIQKVSDCDPESLQEGQKAQYWSVVGTLKAEKAEGLQSRMFPVADLPSELYAELFAKMCEQATDKA